MKIAVIGSGNVGSALGGSFRRAGHDVVLAARDADKTRQAAEKVGARAATSLVDAARDADVIVLAVPYGAAADVARELAPVVGGKVVVDVTNPLKPDYSGVATAGGPSAAELLADRLDGARVVKAFNTLFASVQGDPGSQGTTIDALYATDDERARATLSDLATSMGLRPVFVGGLAAARELEAMAWLNIRLQLQQNGSWRTSFVLVGAPEEATKPAAAAAAGAR